MHFTPAALGSKSFREDYGTLYTYMSGAMYKAIASKEMVVCMGKAGYLGIYGSGGVPLDEVSNSIRYIQHELSNGESYGVNIVCSPSFPNYEQDLVNIFLRYGVRVMEASAFMHVTPALVHYRLNGLTRKNTGEIVAENKILAKISRPEVAAAFLNPAPRNIVESLLQNGDISTEQAELSSYIPMADDLCAEADSGGHTDMGVMTALLPTIIRQAKEICGLRAYSKPVRVGAAGGIGTPEAVASAYLMGAAFVLTGSINQCTVEAGTSDAVKDMLQQLNIQDTDYAPAGDMFELGAKVQVMKRGVFFPVRANKLYDLWRTHSSLYEIDERTRQQIEIKFFGKSFDEVYEETKEYYLRVAPHEIDKAERTPKYKMSLVFRWYFIHSTRLAMSGSEKQRMDYQVHTGPAMGAFNQWAKGTDMENWRNRHVDLIADRLMQEAADILNNKPLYTQSV